MSTNSEISQEEVGLLRAARAGNLEKVKNYLNQDVDINVSNPTGLSSLHLASKEGHTDIVKELVGHGADVNSKTKKGNGPLHIACLAGQTKVVQILLANGADVNLKAQNGFTPLYMASQEDHVETVKLLLANGANLQALTEDGFTALDVAVQQDHEAVVIALLRREKRKGFHALHDAARKDLTKPMKFLIQKGHSVDIRAPNGFTPLHIAAKYNSANAAALLINSGSDIDALTKTYAITPLHAASKFGHANIVTVLLQGGAKPDKPNRDGLTSLHCACREGHTIIAENLLAYNSSIAAKTKNGLTPLHLAVQGNHSKTIVSLIDYGAPLNAVAVDGLCPIHIAAHYGHVEATEVLLGKGVDTDSRARNGFTPLHIACKKSHEPVIHLLLKYGANINAVNEGGQTPMHVAAYYGNVSVVVMLLQNGGSPDVTNMRGETVLHIACRIRNINIVRLLLRNGAAVDAKTQSRETALHIAVKSRNLEMVKLLLDHGASCENVDRTKCTPLHLAARNGADEIVQVLFEHKPPLLELNQKGFTPLHEAARYGHVTTVELLLHHYPSPDPPGKHAMTPLHVASHYDHVKVALLLLSKNASKYAGTKNGFTPLHIASHRNQNDVAGVLLEHGVEPDTKTKTGVSALHLAAKEGHVAAASMLLDHGANPSIQTNNGLTPLHVCARYDRVEVAKLLLKYRAEINVQTKSGFTPLHIACHCGYYEIAKLLLENDANVEMTTTQGYMPLHFAAQQGHTKIIELLLSYSAPPDAVTKEGFTALYIAQYMSKTVTTVEWKYILEMLLKVTTSQISITVLEKVKPGQEVKPVELPEELDDDESSEGTVTLEEEENDEENRSLVSDEMYLQSFMPDDASMRDNSLRAHPIDQSARSTPDSSYHEHFRDISSPLSPFKSEHDRGHSQLFEDDVVVVSESLNVEATPSYNFEASDLDKLPTDNITRGPPVSGGFLISFMVDARGCEMRSSETGLKMKIPAKSCRMPTRITCRLLKTLKQSLMPPIGEHEAKACRFISLAPNGVKFIKPVTLEVPHFASLRNEEREMVILSSFDGGQTWKELAVDNGSDQEDISIHTQYVTIKLTEFPGKLAVISRLRKQTFITGEKSEIIKSLVIPQCIVNIPEGAVNPGTMLDLQVQPVDEHFNDQQEGAAISSIVKLGTSGSAFSRPLTISFPTPAYTRRHEYEVAPTQRLLKHAINAPGSNWNDITSSTPLKVVSGCATFTTEEPGRYCLVDTFNDSDVSKDTRLMYKKLSSVPYMAKFVVFAKLSADGSSAKLRVFCMTDDKVDKTLETQTGFTEVACSRNIEICEGQTVFFHCKGNMATKVDETLQLNFFAFRENRLPLGVDVVDPNEPMKMKLAVILNPRRDHHGKVHAACVLDINLSSDNVGRDTGVQEIPDKLVQLIAKKLAEDWIAFGQQVGLDDSKLQDILDLNNGNTEASASEVIKIWKDKQGPEATVENLEVQLQTIGRSDILKNFKHLVYSSYGTKERLLVTEIRRSSHTEGTNGFVDGNGSELIDPSTEMSVQEKRYSGFHEEPAELPEEQSNCSTEDKEADVIQGLFSDNEEVLKFFQDGVNENAETEID